MIRSRKHFSQKMKTLKSTELTDRQDPVMNQRSFSQEMLSFFQTWMKVQLFWDIVISVAHM